ncbi:MAG: anion transporter [Chloroflexi bacterium]|nr:anion transporter [Chloroflexota bacterium]
MWVTLIIVGMTYVGIAIGHWPKTKTNRTTIALIGAGLLIVTQQIPFAEIGKYLDLNTLILLFGMMIVNSYLRIAGFFNTAGNAILRLAHGPKAFLALEVVTIGVLSAFFLNDTIVLMLTPLIVDIAFSLKREPIPYLIALAAAANVGSVATLTGNPQNMIIGIASGIPYREFSAALAPIAILSLGVIWVVVVKLYPQEFNVNHFNIRQLPKGEYNRTQIIKSVLVTLSLLAALLAGVPIAEAAFIAACVLLLVQNIRPEIVFAEFDWGLLVFFAGLFVVTGSLESNKLGSSLLAVARPLLGENVLGLTAVTTLLSNVISNVPAVLLLKTIVANLTQARAGWLTLAAASTLAGNLTLVGSVANLIVAEGAAKKKVYLKFWEYTRAGALITVLTLGIAVVWLHFFIWI